MWKIIFAIVTFYCPVVMANTTPPSTQKSLVFWLEPSVTKRLEPAQNFDKFMKKKKLSGIIQRISNPFQINSKSRLSADLHVAFGKQHCHRVTVQLQAGKLLCLDMLQAELLYFMGQVSANTLFFGLHSDAPLHTIIRVAHKVLPNARNMSLLLGPSSPRLIGEIKAIQLPVNLPFFVIRNQDSPIRAFQHLAQQSDAVIIPYDPIVYEKSGLPGLLLSSFRLNVPVIGFSETMTQAGALFSISSDPDRLEQQTHELIFELMTKDHHRSRLFSPTQLSVSVNAQVAKSLDIVVNKQDIENALIHIQVQQEKAQ